MGSFVQRRLSFEFTLANNLTFDGTNDTVIISDVKSQCAIDMPGSESMPSASIQIYGIDKKTMDALTLYPWSDNSITRTQIIIRAGTSQKDMSVIFSGQIFSAFANYESAPEVAFIIRAQTALDNSLAAVDPYSFPGVVPVETIAKTLANDLGVTLINTGVTKELNTLTDEYLAGTTTAKLWKLRKDANIDVYFVPPNMEICAKNMPRKTDNVVVIAPNTGMIGWPVPDGAGFVYLNVLYNPAIFHGGEIEIQSTYPNTNGIWYVISMTHQLEAQVSGGAWMSKLILGRTQNSIRT